MIWQIRAYRIGVQVMQGLWVHTWVVRLGYSLGEHLHHLVG